MGTAPDRDYEGKEYFASYDVPLYVRLLDFACLIVGGAFLAAFAFGALSLVAGCSNVTVIKLAEMCHAEHGKPNASFMGDTGKVDCK